MLFFRDKEEILELIEELSHLEDDYYDTLYGMQVYIHPELRDIVSELNKLDWLCVYQAYPDRLHIVFHEDKADVVVKILDIFYEGDSDLYHIESDYWNNADMKIPESISIAQIKTLFENVTKS